MNGDYSYNELVEAYRRLDVKLGDILYVTGNLGILGKLAEVSKKSEILQRHFEALMEVIGNEGTLLMPTFTFRLCNTDHPFSLKESKCETGVFPDFLRKQSDTYRSLHPFSSFVAFGKHANFLCTNNSAFAYGPYSPFARLLQFEGKNISIGMPPEKTCSMVHHAEQTMNVPYRYIKEFLHPILEADGTSNYKEFYLHCLYRNLDAPRDQNEKIMAAFRQMHSISESSIGKGKLYAYSYNDFFESTKKSIKDDPYIWLKSPPTSRAFRK